MINDIPILENLSKNIDLATRLMKKTLTESKSDISLALECVRYYKHKTLSMALIPILAECDTIDEYNRRKLALVGELREPGIQENGVRNLLQQISDLSSSIRVIIGEIMRKNKIYKECLEYINYLGGYQVDDGDIEAYNHLKIVTNTMYEELREFHIQSSIMTAQIEKKKIEIINILEILVN